MLANAGIALMEKGLLPDALLRWGIRKICEERLQEEAKAISSSDYLARRLAALRASPVALLPDKANEQHYEVPAEFFQLVLGKRLKYSCCLYPNGNETLDQAEEAMLELYSQRAELADGMKILELGCGWGSLTLWMAEHFPNAQITAVSNSVTQREFIQSQARARNLVNVQIITCDMNDFHIDQQFDRVVSVEMFEHMRNYQELLRRVSRWLNDHGKLFVHIFCHKKFCYPYETEGAATNWMGQYFFSGGYMPSEDLFSHFQNDLKLTNNWRVDGSHYQKTAMHWLENLDRNRSQALTILQSCYGKSDAERWLQRWRAFFLACAELFGYRDGTEWIVGHYLMERHGLKD